MLIYVSQRNTRKHSGCLVSHPTSTRGHRQQFSNLCVGPQTAQKLAGSCSCCFRYLSIINLILKGGRIALTKQAALIMNRWVTQLLSSAAEGVYWQTEARKKSGQETPGFPLLGNRKAAEVLLTVCFLHKVCCLAVCSQLLVTF